jgi:hypothetical protein
MMAVIRKKAVQTTLLGSLLVACALNISTWTFALHIFLKAEKEVSLLLWKEETATRG